MPVSSASVDATIRHQAMLEGLKRNHEKIVLPYLQTLDKKLRLKLTRSELTTYNRKRLEALIKSVGDMTENILSGATADLTLELNALAKAEAAFESKALDNAVQNPGFNAKTPAAAQVRAAINAAPLAVSGAAGGQLLKPFMKGWTKAQRDMVEGAIRNGAFTGATNAVILKTIRGTASAKFKDGLLGRTAAQFRAVVHTGVQHVSSVARMETYAANSDLVKKYRWSSTLDNKTTEICQSLDGREFEVGNGPIPPAHVNCRSSTVPVLDEDFKFLREGATRASMGGPVPANQTYFDWLKKQPASFQDSVLGKTRGKLLRNGGLTSEEFAKLRIDQKTFQPLTLKEMQAKVPEAFKRAGIYLNPKTGLPATPPKPVAPKPAPKKKTAPKKQPVVETPPVKKELFDEITVHEPWNLGSKGSVTNAELTKTLRTIGTPEAARVVEFINKQKVGTVYGEPERLGSRSWKMQLKKPERAAEWKKFREEIGKSVTGSNSAPYGSKGAQQAGGYTSRYTNYVVLVDHIKKEVGYGIGKLNTVTKEKLQDIYRGIFARKDFPKWEKSQGGLPGPQHKAFTVADEGGRRLKQGPGYNTILTWLHELGHQVDFRMRYAAHHSGGNYWKAYELPDDIIRITGYSHANDLEWFAETFTAWVVDRQALFALDPRAVEIIDKAVETAINYAR